MKKTASLLLGLVLLASTSGCYCWSPLYGGMGMPLGGCPPMQQQQITPMPSVTPGAALHTIDGIRTALPAPTAIYPPVVLETLPTFK